MIKNSAFELGLTPVAEGIGSTRPVRGSESSDDIDQAFGEFYDRYKPGSATLALIVILGTLLLAAFAYLVMIFYDMPVRAYLRSKLLGGNLRPL